MRSQSLSQLRSQLIASEEKYSEEKHAICDRARNKIREMSSPRATSSPSTNRATT